MKKTIALFLAGACATAQAVLIPFDLSPAGTDVAVGLSPSNEVHAVTNSVGSGNEISAGIVFDTETLELQLAVGYGSAAGFSNLTGAAQGMHIHGPAGPGTNADVIVSLAGYSFPAPDPANGGTIYGVVPFPTNQVDNLLAGLTYLNIHTAEYPGGEIRGQLVPAVITNSAPEIGCPSPVEAECGEPVELTVLVSDPEGDALAVVWSVNGTAMQTNSLSATGTPAAANVIFSVTLPLGTNEVGVTVTDSATNTASCSTTVTVVDTKPPVTTYVRASRNVLWPPNHKMITVALKAKVTDDCGPATWKIIEVSSSEDDNGKGDGNTEEDWAIVDDTTVQLRAERSGNGKGRLYSITIQAEDAAGNLSETRTVNVIVPKSKGKSSMTPAAYVVKQAKTPPKTNGKPSVKTNNGKALGKSK